MVVSFNVTPIGQGADLEQQIAEIIRIVDSSGLSYQTHAMATEVEGEWDEVMSVIKQAHETGRKFSGRVLTHITIDDHVGAKHDMSSMLQDVEEILGKSLERV